MPSPADPIEKDRAANPSFRNIAFVTRIGILVAVGLILFLFEAAIPRPLPWLKPGLSNLATILALYLYGFRAAFLVMFLRVLLGAFILGTLFNPVFIFGFSGGFFATLVMALAYHNFKDVFSIIGISVLGAFCHNLVQVLLAAYLVIANEKIIFLMPLMLLSSLFSGFLVGILAHYILERLDKFIIK